MSGRLSKFGNGRFWKLVSSERQLWSACFENNRFRKSTLGRDFLGTVALRKIWEKNGNFRRLFLRNGNFGRVFFLQFWNVFFAVIVLGTTCVRLCVMSTNGQYVIALF